MSQFNQDIYITVYDELGKPIEIRFVTDSEPHQRLKNYGDCDFYLHLKTNEEKLNANIFNLIEDAVMVMKKNQKAFPANSERPFKQLITLNPDRDERLYFRRAEGRENIPLGTIIMVLDRILDYFQEELHLLDEEDQKAMEKSKSMWDEEFDDHQDDPKEKNISTVKFDEVEHSEYGSIDGERYEGQTTHSAWDWEDEHTNDNELDQWKSEQFKSSEPDNMDVWRQTEDQSGSQENDFAQWGFDDNSKEDKSEDTQEDNHHFSSFNDENHFDDNTSNYPSNESGMDDDHFVHDGEEHDEKEGSEHSFNDNEYDWNNENSFTASHSGGSDDFSYNTHDNFEEQQDVGQIDSHNGQDFGFPDIVSSEQIESTQQEDEFISQFDQDKESEEDILNESVQNQESESLNKSDSIDNGFNTQSNEEENNVQEIVEQKKKDDDLKRKNNELLPEENGDDDDFLKELGA